MYEQISRNMEQLRSYCVEAIEISEQYGFEGVLATHNLFLAFANLVRDKDASQIEIMKDNLILYEQKYGLLFLPYFQGLLAEAYLVVERFQDAFDTTEIILQGVEQSGENWVRPEIFCMMSEAAYRGKLAPMDQITGWYKNAVETAVSQQSTLLLGRILRARNSFELDPETAARYEQLANPDNPFIAVANHDYITRRH